MQFTRYITPLALAAGLALASCGGDARDGTTTKQPVKAAVTAEPTPPTPVEFTGIGMVAGNVHTYNRNYTTRRAEVKVIGTVQPFDAKVSVNDKTVTTDAMGHFSTTVRLKQGKNNIEVYGWATGHPNTYEHVAVHRKLSMVQIAANRRAAAARRAQYIASFKANAKTIPYKQLHKSADAHAGEHVVYHGQIMQIQEDGSGGGIMLLSVTDLGYGIWDDNIWINYDGNVKGAEDDMLTVYGTVVGSKSYETQIGGETYVPEIDAKYIEE